MTSNTQKIKYLFSFLIILFLISSPVQAKIDTKEVFPRLANYYLKWELNDNEVQNLAKWDLLILDMEVQENSPEAIRKIREINPKVIILAYITSQEIMDDFKYYHLADLRGEFKKGIIDDWYLKDDKGNKVSNWPGTYMFNLSDNVSTNYKGQRFNDYLPAFVSEKIKGSGLWDGVFYDNIWGDVAWINSANLDVDNDGSKDLISVSNKLWEEGNLKMLQKTRSLVGNDFLIVVNGRSHEPYSNLVNGMMFENFPAPWEGDGTWSSSVNNYLKLEKNNYQPAISVINTYHPDKDNYKLLRFALSSAMLGDAYFSYDYDTSNHTQLWWYDEYDINLGRAISSPYNPLNNSKEITNGLLRRDFENGSVFVNAGDKKQLQIFQQESFTKIKGIQDPVVNSGERINFINIEPKTGVILLKDEQLIKNANFKNGFFHRFFDSSGKQVKGAEFSFIAAYPGFTETYVISKNNNQTTFNSSAGAINITSKGKTRSFKPFPLFKGPINFSIIEKEGVMEYIVVGPDQGGGPQVLVFNKDEKIIANFFAYDKGFRGGVKVSVVDLDGDGEYEIVTAPGKGVEPLVKVFSLNGKFKFSFLAYDKNFKGGISLAAGDMNNDGFAEIVTIPQGGGGPHVRIFNFQGKVVGGFFAYDKNYRDAFNISLGNVLNSDKLQIIVGKQNPY